MSAVHPLQSAERVLHRLTGLPGGPELLAQARRREDVALVGGAVRDILLGHWPRELDVTVRAGAAELAHELAASVSPSERAYGEPVEPVLHDRFGTASVAWRYGRIDIAERRAESYRVPGALPDVMPGSFEEDLRRRDFTVNAIALPLHGAENEGLVSVEGALDDLRAGRLRVLHDSSFLDDPTRMLRLARYAARLGFEIEPHTRELAAQAIAGGALDTVSGSRLSAELSLALNEQSGRAALRELGSLGVLGALGIAQPFDEQLAIEAETFLPGEARRDVLLLAVALGGRGPGRGEPAQWVETVRGVMNRLDFVRDTRERVLAAAINSHGKAREAAAAPDAATAWWLLDSQSVEAVALAAALAARDSEQGLERVREWLDVQRHVRLEINGDDLVAAGVPEGPEIGYRLRETLRMKREGLLDNSEQELDAARNLEIPPNVTLIETG